MSGRLHFVRPRRIRRGAALTLVFASVLGTGAAAGTWSGEGREGTERRIPVRTVADDRSAADGTADREAVEEAANEALKAGKSGSQAAADVVSRSGDRWSTIYTAGEYEDFRQQLDGEYVGVGLWLRRSEGGHVRVSRVRPDSPAARAGIAPGDALLAVDGHPTRHRPVTEVVARLRGDAGDKPRTQAAAAPGTPVALQLQRADLRRSVTLHRARLRTANVTVERPAAPGGMTRIKVEAFAKGTGEEVREAVRSAPPGGVLLDLRGNTGGLVAEAVTAAAAFLDGGLVATYDVRGSQRALYADRGRATKSPLVVLVDGGTMSAGELLAGALQDRGRAVVIGSPTFGKGSVQMPSKLPDGSVAELTVGHYRTPSGRGVDGRGITPDIPADDRAESRARTVMSGLGGGS
ncbi:S41 family peptidase [Streptomyces purpurogeneiscleroticus]|uniref:S41 family peptidase n=1 Tax=Streptomyces purpurogeneiscleroticus TaxID=68259 RepID=UPI001CBEEA5A|nr:S41 family peptidase [Streptomyces purpurogeneiscleroticus]MBZ4020002.1 peptidase S41 [Streptomyces purpurogeneiscleroticus]